MYKLCKDLINDKNKSKLLLQKLQFNAYEKTKGNYIKYYICVLIIIYFVSIKRKYYRIYYIILFSKIK